MSEPSRKPRKRKAGQQNRIRRQRRHVRVLTMQVLFELDQVPDRDVDDVLARLQTQSRNIEGAANLSSDDKAGQVAALMLAFPAREDAEDEAEELELQDIDPHVVERTSALVRGILQHQTEIDTHISNSAPAFPLPQLAAIDRCILRLAIYELIWAEPKAPWKSVINEAVEIAKQFGGERSGSFVNGVLGTVARSVVPENTETR